MVVFEGRVKGFHPDQLGFTPAFLSETNPMSASEQLNAGYVYGGGWSPFDGFEMLSSGNMRYPGDPPLRLIAEGRLRDEIIRVYEHSWVAVVQPDGSFEVSRMD